MFSLAQPAFYPSYKPYEQLLLQQELQRRRRIEAYLRQQREAEELERRRAYERALLQAEYERRCAAEYERQRRAEVEHLRRQSMFDGGMQDLFDAIYGRARAVSPQREDVHEEQNATVNDKAAPQTPPTPSTPSPPPASDPVPPGAEAENEQTEDAAPQVDTAPSLAVVQSILASFASLQSDFTFPTHLDFLPSSSKLAYTPNNAPLHGYEHALTGLLTQLDAVESFGDDKLRKARKEAVKTIELELEKLDESKAEAWKKQAQPEPVAPVPEVTPLGPTVVSPEPESAPSEMEVDPVTVPLPQDSDEDVSEAVVDSDEHSAAEVVISAECSLPTPEVVSALVQSPVVEGFPPLPSSPSLSDSGDAESDMELEEYIEVGNVAPASETALEAEAEEEAVEKDEDLELMRDWDFEL